MNNEMITLDYNNLMADVIGAKDGVTKAELFAMKDISLKYLSELKKEREEKKIRFYDLPAKIDEAKEIQKFVKKRKDAFDNFVVLGIGGSALGNIALQTALSHPYYNYLSKTKRNGYPRVFVIDNIDPDQFEGLLDILNPEKTLFNVISKSGGTAETMSHFMIIHEMLKKKFGKKLKKNVVVTTDVKGGYLRQITDEEKYDNFIVPEGVGGRFTVLSPVGLLSAAFAGIDIIELLKGAKKMADACLSDSYDKNISIINAVLHYILDTKKGKHISVMMPYAAGLKDFADWYRQLWAESLGKKFDLDGKTVNLGPTPIKALGATDQHSQVQLYVEGPKDKAFTFLSTGQWKKMVTIPEKYTHIEGVGYLSNHTMNELMKAEKLGTEIALTEAGRPNCTINFPSVTPNTIGQFIMLYEAQTAFSGKLYRINPFDQPGVEAGKIAAFALMGRKGYEKRKDEIESKFKKNEDMII
jgi:glucose-6-phosphate isomerase